MKKPTPLSLSLFLMRVSIFLVMLIWTLDKLINPKHAAGVFAHFYKLPDLTPTHLTVIGIIELLVIIAFVLGIKKKWTYGAVLIAHTLSTLSSYKLYLNPFDSPNMLFWTAFPMLAGCVLLFLLREEDTYFTVS